MSKIGEHDNVLKLASAVVFFPKDNADLLVSGRWTMYLAMHRHDCMTDFSLALDVQTQAATARRPRVTRSLQPLEY